MPEKFGFIHALGASALTSVLMLLDRVILNLLPILYWGVDVAGLWIFFRAWMFLLMSLEGGVGGRLSNEISLARKKGELYRVDALYLNSCIGQFYWGIAIFLLNASIVYFFDGYLNQYLFFDISSYKLELILIGLYSALYYQSQLGVYRLRGDGRVFRGQMTVNVAKSAEVLVLLLTPILGFGILGCLVGMILVRLMLLISFGFLFQVKHGFSTFTKFEPRVRSFTANVSYFLYPATPAVYNFCPLLLIGTLLEPAGVVIFSISKLFGRVLVQLSQILSRVLWPEVLGMPLIQVRSFLIKVLGKYSIVLTSSLFLIITMAYMVDGLSYSGINFQFKLILVLVLGAYVTAYNDVLASVLIAVEKHFYPFLFRFLFALISPLILVFIIPIGLSVTTIAIYYLMLEIFIFLLFFIRTWRSI